MPPMPPTPRTTPRPPAPRQAVLQGILSLGELALADDGTVLQLALACGTLQGVRTQLRTLDDWQQWGQMATRLLTRCIQLLDAQGKEDQP